MMCAACQGVLHATAYIFNIGNDRVENTSILSSTQLPAQLPNNQLPPSSRDCALSGRFALARVCRAETGVADLAQAVSRRSYVAVGIPSSRIYFPTRDPALPYRILEGISQ